MMREYSLLVSVFRFLEGMLHLKVIELPIAYVSHLAVVFSRLQACKDVVVVV